MCWNLIEKGTYFDGVDAVMSTDTGICLDYCILRNMLKIKITTVNDTNPLYLYVVFQLG